MAKPIIHRAPHIMNASIGWGILHDFDTGNIQDADDFELEQLRLHEVGPRDLKTLRVQPQVIFRPVYIRVITDFRELKIDSFRVGNVECLMTAMPAYCVADDGELSFPLVLPVVNPEKVLMMTFSNPKREKAFFQVWLEGAYGK